MNFNQQPQLKDNRFSLHIHLFYLKADFSFIIFLRAVFPFFLFLALLIYLI